MVIMSAAISNLIALTFLRARAAIQVRRCVMVDDTEVAETGAYASSTTLEPAEPNYVLER